MDIFGIKKLSEGNDVKDVDIPIDIHDNKLIEWLVSRKTIRSGWEEAINKIEQMIEVAINDLPDSLWIKEYMSANDVIGYQHVQEIIDLLIENGESQERNFFGKYNSPLIAQWNAILDTYKKNNVYLSQAATILVQNVKYEIPSIKKDMDKNRGVITSCEKKISEISRNKKETLHKFEVMCRDIGIKGDNIREEIISLTDNLDNLFTDIQYQMQEGNIKQCIEYYKGYVNHHLQQSNLEMKNFGELEYLEHIINYKNEPLYRVEKRKADPNYEESDEETDFPDALLEENGQQITVNWDINIEEPVQPDLVNDVIDWGISLESAEGVQGNVSDTPTINWDITIEDEGDSVPEINWNIDVESETSTQQEQTLQKQTILENHESRKSVLYSLFEIRDFLTVREQSLNNENVMMVTLGQIANAPEHVKKSDNNSQVEKYLNSVKGVIDRLESEEVVRLLEIKFSERYLDRLTQSVEAYMNQANRMDMARISQESRMRDAQHFMETEYPKYRSIRQETINLKGFLEKEISKLYSGRPVTIIGQISQLQREKY
eukprot:TRINITY_DN1265_c0_g1_i4.p2 TRINITY_DN1265_c0_g1~~TRINITY_DN1265_c0_g1_i4.p2  ORF type:complete len:547 (-),score=129.62 TRINITY_DN1265_c0_g1_i4:2349-3989(-)